MSVPVGVAVAVALAVSEPVVVGDVVIAVVAAVAIGADVVGDSVGVVGAIDELDWTDASIGSQRRPLLDSHWIELPSPDTPAAP